MHSLYIGLSTVCVCGDSNTTPIYDKANNGNIMRHRFKTQYTEENFLNALSKTDLRTAGFIAGVVGCTLPTAKTYLKSLTEREIIDAVLIDDGQIVAYKLKKQ